MTYTLALVNGDLAPQGGQLALVWGVDKLKQEIDIWLRERIGVDRFHPRYGSDLENFIGSVVDQNTSVEVNEEIVRVLRNYQAVQQLAFKSNPQDFSLSELLMEVVAVNSQVRYDTVNSSVTVANGERVPVTTNTTTAVS